MNLSRALYAAARLTRDAASIRQSATTGSIKPVVKRAANKLIGRFVVAKLWWR